MMVMEKEILMSVRRSAQMIMLDGLKTATIVTTATLTNSPEPNVATQQIVAEFSTQTADVTPQKHHILGTKTLTEMDTVIAQLPLTHARHKLDMLNKPVIVMILTAQSSLRQHVLTIIYVTDSTLLLASVQLCQAPFLRLSTPMVTLMATEALEQHSKAAEHLRQEAHGQRIVWTVTTMTIPSGLEPLVVPAQRDAQPLTHHVLVKKEQETKPSTKMLTAMDSETQT
jgi:hypothetical protein